MPWLVAAVVVLVVTAGVGGIVVGGAFSSSASQTVTTPPAGPAAPAESGPSSTSPAATTLPATTAPTLTTTTTEPPPPAATWHPQLLSVASSAAGRAEMERRVAEMSSQAGVELAFASHDDFASLSPGWWAVYEPVPYPDGPSAYARARELGPRLGIVDVSGNYFSQDPADNPIQHP